MIIRSKITWALACACVIGLAHPAQAITQQELDAARATAARSPHSPDAQFELAMAYARTSYLEHGWEALKRVNELDAGYAAKVVERYEARLAAHPEDADALFRLGFGYYFQDRKALAMRQFEKLIAIRPDDPWAHNYMGFLQAEAGRLDQALVHWQKALTLDQDNAVAHYLIGQIHYRQGRLLQAAQSLGQAVRLRAASALKP
ncbi:MAG: tetratricopeptide repeat protein [Candidatus Sericytochromatia bacterium]